MAPRFGIPFPYSTWSRPATAGESLKRRSRGVSLFPTRLIFGIEYTTLETERGSDLMIAYLFILLGALYFFFPYDLFPDFIPSFGRIDDLLLMAYLYWTYKTKYKQSSSPGPDPDSFSYERDGARRQDDTRSDQYESSGSSGRR